MTHVNQHVSLIPFSIEKGDNTYQRIAEMSIAAILFFFLLKIVSVIFSVWEMSFWALTTVVELLWKFLTLIFAVLLPFLEKVGHVILRPPSLLGLIEWNNIRRICDYNTLEIQPASAALLVASWYVLPGYGDRRVWDWGPGSPDHCVRCIAVYALRLNSRAGTEGSTVSSLICDRWLILGSETLSISHRLNHW